MTYNLDYHYWQYFLSLENDLITTSRYIDFRDADNELSVNAKAYSIELVKIFFSACAECENIGKILAGITGRGNIDSIKAGIINPNKPQYAKLPRQEIFCPAYNLTFTPWDAWLPSSNPVPPSWWTKHNNVKHSRFNINNNQSNNNRGIQYENANLFNTLNAVAGLMCLLFNKMQSSTQNSGNIKYRVLLPSSLAPKLFRPSVSGLTMNSHWEWQENP